MIQMEAKPDIMEITATGTLSGGDYDLLVPKLESFAAEEGPLRVLIELRDFTGWTPSGLWKEVRFDATHQDDLDRVAVVGENGWEEWGTKLSKPFFKADVKFFPRERMDEARAWLRA